MATYPQNNHAVFLVFLVSVTENYITSSTHVNDSFPPINHYDMISMPSLDLRIFWVRYSRSLYFESYLLELGI